MNAFLMHRLKARRCWINFKLSVHVAREVKLPFGHNLPIR